MGSTIDERKRRELRALQFNVWLDATRVRGGIGLTADKIIESKADVVSLVEVKNLLGDFVERLKKELQARGVKYYGQFAGNPRKLGVDADTAILSRYPITSNTIVYRTRENCIVKAMIDVEGSPLAVYSLHLEYRCYTCYLPRGYRSNSYQYPGWSMLRVGNNITSYWDVLSAGLYRCGWMDVAPHPMVDPRVIHQDNVQSKRPEVIARLIEDTSSLEDQDIPIVVMGDFNEPSTLDWTEETANLTDHNGLVYSWDSTELLKQNNFVDSYREVYPDPVTHPGYTFPAAAQSVDSTQPKKTAWIKKADERDRIDFIFYKEGSGNNHNTSIRARDAWLVGTPISVVRDAFANETELGSQDKFSQEANTPWPSDHRAVLAVFDVAM